MSDQIENFMIEYPPETLYPVDGENFASEITEAFGVKVPRSLISFWNRAGVGYYSDRELCFFRPSGMVDGQRTLIEWNSLACWRDVLVHPSEGGPVFVAESCIGDQIGFRYASDGSCKAVLFAIDTCELFVMMQSFDELIPHLLDDPHTIVDPELLSTLRLTLGPLPEDSHYAPIVPVLAGGSIDPRNYHIETASVHIKTVIATWKSLG